MRCLHALRRTVGVLAAATVAIGVASSAVPASAHPASKKPAVHGLSGLQVLLTNDDSMQDSRANQSDGRGLYEVRKALCAAGADVVTIAPWSVQSGRGTAVTNSGTIRLGTKPLQAEYINDCKKAPSKGLVYGLCVDTAPCSATSPGATPSDTVKFATRGGLHDLANWKGEPDLVVSGSNSGNNIANSVTDSGTVGATIAAIEEGIPAVALSSANAKDGTYPVQNYRATAEWGTKLMVGLRKEGLLRQHKFSLNVNYPNITDGTPARRAKWASISDGTFAYHSYVRQADGSYQISLAPCTGLAACIPTRPDADKTLVMDRNHITVTPINWDRTYGHAINGKRELTKVKSYIQHSAPRP